MSTPIGSSQWMYATGAAAPQQSLKFNDNESQYLSWTPASAGNRRTWTWSGWVKRGNLAAGMPARGTIFGSSLTLLGFFNPTSGVAADNFGVYVTDGEDDRFMTNRVFRDTSAWYHFVVVLDTTNSTADDRFRLYVNGVRETSFSRADTITQNRTAGINATAAHAIGRQSPAASQYFDGYLSDIHFIDGQALDASSFGETVDGYWKAKDYAGTYGTNGFHLTFQDDVVSEGFNTVTYAGNGSTQSVSGLGFSPDLVWIKTRQAESHGLWDSVRGAPLNLSSNNTNAEGSYTGVTSFDADGFSLGGAYAGYTESGKTYVAWCWDAGSGSAASNTDGSITSSVKANPDYGFSIVSYTGTGSSTTTGHGLNSAPELVIIKDRDSAQDWNVYHVDVGTTNILALNSTSAAYADGAAMINSTAPTSSVVHIGFGGASNGSGRDYIAYCFHSVANYSSIGSYSGTGASGNAVTFGFRPAFVMFKRTDAANNWQIYDTTRSTSNPVNDILFADTSGAENVDITGNNFDVTDTGIVINNTSGAQNASGGTYIYMAFADTREAAFWKDVSGQGNHWTPNNLDYRDSLIDSPANNFATLNPINNPDGTFSEGNLKWTSQTTDQRIALATMPVDALGTSDSYAEVRIGSKSSTYWAIGVFGNPKSWNPRVMYRSDGEVNRDGTVTQTGVGTFTEGDVISITYDVSSGTVTFYKNNSLVTTETVGNTDNVQYFGCTSDSSGSSANYNWNFGQDSTFAGATTAGGNQDDNGVGDFKYAPPSGYLALCTANLPTPSIVDGSEYFNAVTYTGTGTTNPVIVGFSPDFTWIKQRNTTRDHQLLDIVRGYTNNIIYTNLTNAEDVSVTARIDSRDADGFTVITPTQVNQSGGTYAAWNWKAGGTAVSNTAGSITSSVSANTTAGFSIATYTGTGANASFGHGLGVAPDMVIVKRRDTTDGWIVFHKDLTTGHILILDSTTASFSSNQFSPDPSSSVVSVLNQPATNASGGTYVAYSFANTDGYLKAGSYTGNGSTDGPFVHTGFRPAFVIVKNSSTTGSWRMYDTKRPDYNPEADTLYAEGSYAEDNTSERIDILSNGFKLRNSLTNNGSGVTVIYLAFAETPFKFANAR